MSERFISLEEVSRCSRFSGKLVRHRVAVFIGLPLSVILLACFELMGLPLLLCLLIVMLGGGTALLVWRLRMRPSNCALEQNTPGAGKLRAGRARLLCRGYSGDLEYLRGLSDVHFEPVIVSSIFPVSTKRLSGISAIVVLIAVPLCALTKTPLWIALCSQGATWWISAVAQKLRPVYYRIIPSRVDILYFNFWRTRSRKTHSILLDDAEILCEFDKNRLEIRESGAMRTPIAFDLLAVSDPRLFVKAIFQAAICTSSPAPLPSDELLG